MNTNITSASRQAPMASAVTNGSGLRAFATAAPTSTAVSTVSSGLTTVSRR
jgi:hypothetical protein